MRVVPSLQNLTPGIEKTLMINGANAPVWNTPSPTKFCTCSEAMREAPGHEYSSIPWGRFTSTSNRSRSSRTSSRWERPFLRLASIWSQLPCGSRGTVCTNSCRFTVSVQV